jgi:hypothetical protein
MDINEAYDLLESISNGSPISVDLICHNFYDRKKRYDYRLYIQDNISITGKSFEECFNKIAMTIQQSDGHFYKKILRDHKKKLKHHKILFRNFYNYANT